ncbi:MAG: tRNA pseudouridine(55) synthase TruB [Planctomycetota bacterium]|nr:tRNA pseudouridine(55) synthase TruB [Planctomycetota bacterium]
MTETPDDNERGRSPEGVDAPFPEVRRAFLENPLALLDRVPGIWPMNKPKGVTSHDVVKMMRKRLGLKRVGHAGTLDPMAEGLLLVTAGLATRLFDDIQSFRKTYRAEFRLGERTVSQDSAGDPVAGWRRVVDPPVAREKISAAMSKFVGGIEQVPPMHSALKRNGTPLYKLARRGIEVERSPRKAMVHELSLEAFDGWTGRLLTTVSSGFYVRTLIDDIGLALGAGAVMTALVRTAIGPFALDGSPPPGDGGERAFREP